MWILLIFLIELGRFLWVLKYLQLAGFFTGILGCVSFLIVDWLFFFVALPVLFNYFPLARIKPGNTLGEWLRGRIDLQVKSDAPQLAPDQPYVFACHGHGVIATSQLLLFMLPPTELPGLHDYQLGITSTVSSQLYALPLTSIVCRMLGAVSITHFERLLLRSEPFALSPGGATEISLVQFDDARTLHIQKRTGFLQYCYLKKRPIVPLLTLNNHSMYRTPGFLRSLQWFSYKLIGYGMPLPSFGTYGSIVPQQCQVRVARLPTFLNEGDEENFEAYTARYYKALTDAAAAWHIELRLVTSQQTLEMLGARK